MGYVLPTFNLAVRIWRNGNAPPAAADVVTVGNLTPGRRHITPFFVHPVGVQLEANMHLLLPAGTDIRDAKAAGGADLAEVPAFSGRFYDVAFVDDIGFGFANEHRFAQLTGKGPWPTPFPTGAPPVPIAGGGTCALATSTVLNVTYSLTATATFQFFFLASIIPPPPATFSLYWNSPPTPPDNMRVHQGSCAVFTTLLIGNNDPSPNSFITDPLFANQLWWVVVKPVGSPDFPMTFRFTQP